MSVTVTAEATPASLYPYTERAGVAAHVYTEALLAPPEIQLLDVEKEAAYAFADCLYQGRVHARSGEPIVCEANADLKQVYRKSTTNSEQEFYLGYFATEPGQEDLARIGLEPDVGPEQIIARLHDVPFMRVIRNKERKDIAKRSLDWQKELLAERLLEPGFGEAEPEKVTVNYEPAKLLEKMSDLQAFRRFYRSVWRDMKEHEDSPLKEAKQALLEVHVARVNNLVAELYPQILNLAQQLDQSPRTAQNEVWEARLIEVAPVLNAVYHGEQAAQAERLEHFADDLNRRLDFVRQGAAHVDGHNFSPISHELADLATQSRTTETTLETAFEPEILEILDTTTWNAGQVSEFVTAVLVERDQLSQYTATPEEVDKRDGPAPDGRWQVVVHDKKDSFNADPAKRVVVIPKSFERTLTQMEPAGVLPVTAHETTHVEQNGQNERLGELIPLADVKGRRYLTTREMGGIDQERAMHRLFGRTRNGNLHYMRGLRVKVQGGNRAQVARAFYDSYTNGKVLDDAAQAKARKLAVDRTQRLYRHGGHNSQPLDYIEQEMQAEALSGLSEEQRLAVMVACDSFSLADSAKLHRVGLLDVPTSVDVRPAETVLKVFTEKFLPQVLASRN